jgi:hypothetical protein
VRRYPAVLLLLLTAGCASAAPDPVVSQPKAEGAQPATPRPAAAPVSTTTKPAPAAGPAPSAAAPVASKDAPPVAKTPAPVAKTPAPVAKTPVPVAKAPAPVAKTPAPPATASKGAAPPVAASRVAAPPVTAPLALDLDALKARLKATKAIGVFTKIALKNQVDDLMKQFRGHYEGKAKPTMTELRSSYDLLMMKVLSLVQDDDKTLASAIFSSREAIWGLLSDPKKFAALET